MRRTERCLVTAAGLVACRGLRFRAVVAHRTTRGRRAWRNQATTKLLILWRSQPDSNRCTSLERSGVLVPLSQYCKLGITLGGINVIGSLQVPTPHRPSIAVRHGL